MSVQSSEIPTESDEWRKSHSKKGRKRYFLEYRVVPEEYQRFITRWYTHANEWRSHWRNYATEADRDEALRNLNKKDHLFEYRLPQGT